MNIFKRTYTAKDVTRKMTALMLVYLNEMQQCVERKQMSDALVKEKSMLMSLGLGNTKNFQLIASHEKELAEYNANVDCFKLMTEAWKIFGNDVMIVRYDQFMQLLEKYNLVCGELSRYKGYIPEKNLQEIAGIKNMDIPEKFAVHMEKLKEVNLSCPLDELIKSVRFPYSPEGIDALGKMGIDSKAGVYGDKRSSIYSSNLSSMNALYLMRLPFEERARYLKREEEIEAKRREKAEAQRLANMPRFFIAAPAQEMAQMDLITRPSSDRQDIKKRDVLNSFANIRIRTKDPFFCSCTAYGVLIFSKWGDEAQDVIIKRYEQLSQVVNN